MGRVLRFAKPGSAGSGRALPPSRRSRARDRRRRRRRAARARGVMVLSSKGGVCSAVVVARDVVLTAAHCATGADQHRVHWMGEDGKPVLIAPAAKAVHPGYDAKAIAARRRSIDLALLRLPRRCRPGSRSRLSPQSRRRRASPSVYGCGLAREGEARAPAPSARRPCRSSSPTAEHDPALGRGRRRRRLPGRFRRPDGRRAPRSPRSRPGRRARRAAPAAPSPRASWWPRNAPGSTGCSQAGGGRRGGSDGRLSPLGGEGFGLRRNKRSEAKRG